MEPGGHGTRLLWNHSDMVTRSCQVTQGDMEPSGTQVTQ